jgi:hypothetical protein
MTIDEPEAIVRLEAKVRDLEQCKTTYESNLRTQKASARQWKRHARPTLTPLSFS